MNQKQKIQKYEDVLHTIQMYAEVTMDGEKLTKLISNICSWSYAHRMGNGTLSEKQQKKIIKEKFDKLLDL